MDDLLGPDHEGHEVTWRGTGARWEGNDEVETRRFACSCGAQISVVIRVDVGPPASMQRMRGTQ